MKKSKAQTQTNVEERAERLQEINLFARRLSSRFEEEDWMFTIGNLCGYFVKDSISFLTRALNVTEEVKDYRELLRDVDPIYYSKSYFESNLTHGYIDANYCLTKWYTGKLPQDNMVFLCEVITYQLNTAAMNKRLANLINEVANNQKEDRKIGRALLYTCAALLNKFSDLVLENITVIRNSIEDGEDFKRQYLEKREVMLSGSKAHMVHLMDKYFDNINLVNTTYKRPLSSIKNIGHNTYDKIKEEKEKRRVREFVISLLKTMNDVRSEDYGSDLPF